MTEITLYTTDEHNDSEARRLLAESWRLDNLKRKEAIAELKKALAPFAAAAYYWEAFSPFQEITRGGLRVEHLREAKRVLESL